MGNQRTMFGGQFSSTLFRGTISLTASALLYTWVTLTFDLSGSSPVSAYRLTEEGTLELQMCATTWASLCGFQGIKLRSLDIRCKCFNLSFCPTIYFTEVSQERWLSVVTSALGEWRQKNLDFKAISVDIRGSRLAWVLWDFISTGEKKFQTASHNIKINYTSYAVTAN